MNIESVLRRPVLTEKSTKAMEVGNQYVFEISPNANKTLVRRAVEELFDVKVLKVNVRNRRGRMLNFGTADFTTTFSVGTDVYNPVLRRMSPLDGQTNIGLQQKLVASFNEPIDIACAGGTSMVGGFIEVFREEFAKIDFPIPVGRIFRSEEALTAVAKGCLVAAAIGEE